MNIQNLIGLTTGAQTSAFFQNRPLAESTETQTETETTTTPPADTSAQFVEQLATFSGLELQAESNQKLDQITALLTQQNSEN